MKFLLVFVLIFFQSIDSYCQRIESIAMPLNINGMVEDGDQVIVFGSGLTWLDTLGVIQRRIPVLKGMCSIWVRDVCSDNEGGFWVAGGCVLGRLNKKNEFSIVIDKSEFGSSDPIALKLLDNGTLMVLSQKKIYAVTHDNQYSLYYQLPEGQSNYFQFFDVDASGNIITNNGQSIFIIDAAKNTRTIPFAKYYNLQDIEVTKENKIMVLDKRNLFELINDQLVPILTPDQLAENVVFYDGVFNSVDDYWLAVTDGNVFQFKNGQWKNFIPPYGYKTGHGGSYITQTSSGDIWMMLKEGPGLRYNGSVWNKFDLKKDFPFTYISHSAYLNKRIVSTEGPTDYPLILKDGQFVPMKELGKIKMQHITQNKAGEFIWSTGGGIWKLEGDKHVQIIQNNKDHQFGVLGDQILYNDKQHIIKWKNGTVEKFTNNEHYFGWDRLIDVRYYSTFDNKLFVTVGSSPGQISIYDGNEWNKIIQIDGKLIGNIMKIYSTDLMTFILTERGSVAGYDKNGFRWLHFENDPQMKSWGGFITDDHKMWFGGKDRTVRMVDMNGKYRSIQVPAAGDMILYAVNRVKENVYDLYFGQQILRLYLDED